jgi:hypothetical protein
MTRRLTMIALLAAALGACATPYKEQGFGGGVSATRLDERTLRISARGNSFTDEATVSEYAMIKAAEETLRAGYGHFQIMDGAGTARFTPMVMKGTFIPMWKPGVAMMVRMYPGPKQSDAPEGVYDAHEVMTYIGARYGRTG